MTFARLQETLHSAIDLDTRIVLDAEILKEMLSVDEHPTNQHLEILQSIIKGAIRNAELVKAVKKELNDSE